jgi:ABC-type glycerol-3-phosphate transport system permease component
MVVRHYTDRGVVPELGATATSRDAVRLPAVPQAVWVSAEEATGRRPGGRVTGRVASIVQIPVASALSVGGAVLGVILLAALPSYGVARLAERKGRHFWTWFVMAVLVGWMFVLVAAIVIRPQEPA